MNCPICNDRGVTPNNTLCVCKLKDIIKTSLPQELIKLKTPKLIIDKNLLGKNIYFGGGTINGITPKQIIKAYIINQLINNLSFSFYYGSVKSIFDIYMSSDNDLQSSIVKQDLLVMKIGNDVKNQYILELIPNIIGERVSNNLPTIILWDNKIIKDSVDKTHYIKERYNELTYKYIASDFVIADKAIIIKDKRLSLKGESK